MAQFLIYTENTEWTIDTTNQQYRRRPIRERDDPDSVAGRLLSSVWHDYSTVKVVKDIWGHKLAITTPDLGPEQQGIRSGPIQSWTWKESS